MKKISTSDSVPESEMVPRHTWNIRLSAAGNEQKRSFQRVTPSKTGETWEMLETDKSILEEKNVSELFASHHSRAMKRGIVLHSCFEQISWLDQCQIDNNRLQRVIESHTADTNEQSQMIDDFHRMIRSETVQKLFSYAEQQKRIPNATRIELFGERRFLVRLDARTLQPGSIDRLVLHYKEKTPVWIDVIDFKTDHITNDELESRALYYKPQMMAYRNAVSKMFRIAPSQITVKLLFTSLCEIVEIP